MTIEAWLTRAYHLDRERGKYSPSRPYIKNGIERLWNSLSIEAIYAIESRADLLSLSQVIDSLRLKPQRGHRGGTKWEQINVAILNRLAQIRRAEDAATMTGGHNWSGGRNR